MLVAGRPARGRARTCSQHFAAHISSPSAVLQRTQATSNDISALLGPAWQAKRLVRQHRLSPAHARAGNSKKGASQAPRYEALDDSVRSERQESASRALKQARRVTRQRLELALEDAGVAKALPAGCYLDVLLSGLAEVATGAQQSGSNRAKKDRSTLLSLLAAHRTYFMAALDVEFQEEWKESEERLTWDRARLLDEGCALFDLHAAPDGALYKDAVVRFDALPRALPPHSFAQGDIVLVSRGKPDQDALEGVIVTLAATWVRVAMPRSVAPDVAGPGWRLDSFANTIAYERARAALEAYQLLPLSMEPTHPLRRLLIGDAQGQASLHVAAQVRPPFLRGAAGAKAAAVVKQACRDLASSLNPSQIAAIRLAAASTLSIWQGPPGTGKTRTIVRYVRVMRSVLLAGSGILVTAASNVAVDNMLQGLADLGLNVVRVGHPAKVAETLRHLTLDALVLQHPVGKQAEAVRQKAAASSGYAQANAFQRADELEQEAAKAILDAADVVACTCVGAGGRALEERAFKVVVVDEATQAQEPDCLIAVLKDAESLLLVGDQQQLPPTVRSLAAQRLGLGTSLFVRLMAMGVRPALLDVQYRMHPILAEFSAAAFYDDALRDGVTAAQRPPLASFPWPAASVPVVFYDCRGVEERAGHELSTADASSPRAASAHAPSLRNMQEVAVVKAVVAKLLQDASLLDGAADIGVISPYSAQVKELALALAPLVPANRSGASERGELEVKTVDGFQGREKECIVVSCVRSNAAGSIGFLSDQRRLNVAFTRAKRGLIVVGNADTLRSHALWRAWLGWLSTRPGLIVDANELLRVD